MRTEADIVALDEARVRRVRRRGRAIHHVARAFLVSGLALFAVALATVVALIRIDHLQLEPVLSGSMRPTAQPGDLIVAEKTATSALRVGEVVAFYPPGSKGAPVMHRIVEITRSAGTTTITTKGDANNVVDPWGPIKLASPITYRLVQVVPKLGFVSVWAHRVAASQRALLLIGSGLVLLVVAATSLRGSPRSAQDAHGGRPELKAEVHQ